MESSLGSTSSSYRTPSRLRTASTASLSPPTLSKPQISAETSTSLKRNCSPTSLSAVTSSDGRRQPQSSKNVSTFPGKQSPSSTPSFSRPKSGSELEVDGPEGGRAQDSALTDSENPSGNAETMLQHQATALATYANQAPTIAQRDALTSRVYSMCKTGGYAKWLHLLELSPLASQHHLSSYNCMKFGPQGSPYAYLPLSMQQPWQADALTERQKVNESGAMEWLIQKRKTKAKVEDIDRGVKRGGGILEEDGSRSRKADEDGDDEIEARNSSKTFKKSDWEVSSDSQMREASPTPPNSSREDVVKISGPLGSEATMIQEWEEPIKEGSDAAGSSAGTSAVMTAEESHQREEIHQKHQASSAVKTSDTHPISISPIIPPELLIDITHYVQKGLPSYICADGKVREQIEPDLTTIKHCALQVAGQRLVRCHTTRVDMCEVGQRAELELIEASQSKRKPRNLSFSSHQQADAPLFLKTICVEGYENSSAEEEQQDGKVPLAFGGQFRGFTIGNLLLSSCPGKKVRLTGPVRGRGAICRNLGIDLRRIRELGVGALICCLDDEELGFLGAPWSQYEKEADLLGMEVIRIPMAEGFCPTDVSMTDNIMTSMVEQFTLKGVNILVHCRGGVGRAGLIACTWMLKMGLVRSDQDEAYFRSSVGGVNGNSGVKNDSIRAQPPLPPPPRGTGDENKNRCAVEDTDHQIETMQIINRLIDTIRRRRSPKAIETAEQVAFLFKYITYLKQQEVKRYSESHNSPSPLHASS
ncbi:hypothetical protein CBS101457_003619 [Exobasidium rhododendri]|nr:hypothetical protein CBS101457_003619 [Exobasidium rhododendri]